MAAHSSIPAWRIPGTEEPGGLPSMGSHRVGDDWGDLAAAAAALKPRDPKLLSPHATVTEAYMLWSLYSAERSYCNEKPVHSN